MIEVGIALSLVVIATLVSRFERMELERELGIATIRALLQMFAVAAVIEVIFERLGAAAALLVVMLVVASYTSARRLRGVPGALWRAGLAIGSGSGLAIAILFGAGAFDAEPRFLIPIGGMLIGNCMNATSLAGSRMRDEIVDKSHEVEARLALGVTARTALSTYRRRAATNALVPTIDSTRNVGIIFLPGAFVGMLLGGASPVEAATVQLVVLFMLLGAVAISGVASTRLVAAAFVDSGERLAVPSRSPDG